MTFNDTTPIAALTVGDVKSLICEMNQDAQAPTSTASGQYVYGIRGIEKLFGVSHDTAQNYKNTILKDVCIQRGRKIIVNVEKQSNSLTTTEEMAERKGTICLLTGKYPFPVFIVVMCV